MMKLYLVRLSYRFLLFVVAVASYIYAYIHPDNPGLMGSLAVNRGIWLLCFVGIMLRFFPTKLESRGCEKVFARNYIPKGKETANVKAPNRGIILSLVFWILLNSIFGVLHLTGVISSGVMILLSAFYAVCDDICILFYCPFQSLFMKNRCCVTCRIFAWDYAMICTPLVFVSGIWFKILLILSLVLVARWEIVSHIHPERFSVETNQYLSCEGCKEKLCRFKYSTSKGGSVSG